MTFGIYLMLNVVLLLFLAIWLRRLVVRRLEPERILNDLSNEIGELVAELNQTGDHNVSVLEDRIMQLRDLVADADRQIDELSALVQHVQAERNPAEPVYTVSFSGSAPARDGETAREVSSPSSDVNPSGAVPTVAEGDAGGRSAPGSAAIGEDAPVAGPLFREPPRSASPAGTRDHPPPPTEVLSPREQVHELHQQGLSSEIIAGKTGMAIGEVELIISLGAGKGDTSRKGDT